MKERKHQIIHYVLTINIIIITVILICTGFILWYYYNADIISIPTEEIKQRHRVEEFKYQERKVFTIQPKQGAENEMFILYIHGGSYVAQMSDTHWKFIEKLVEDTKSTVILPDYPLTPKYTYKEVFEFMKPLYKDIIKNIPSDKLIMMGDSAGAGLSLALAEIMGEEDVQQPKKLILISPWLDVDMQNPDIDKVQKYDPILNKEVLKIAGKWYKGKNIQDTFLANPIDGPLQYIKNITIYTGTYDILNPDVHKLIEKTKQYKINIQLEETIGAVHIWLLDEKQYHAKEDHNKLIKEIQEVINE